MNRITVETKESTKTCPSCGSTALARIGTQNLKLCADCPTNMVWKLEAGQTPVYGGNEGNKDE